MATTQSEGFRGPYRRWAGDGLVEFLNYDGAVEWRGRPRSGVVFPPDYEEADEWWWKFTPLSVQLRAYLDGWRMSIDQAAAACAVPTEAALFVLGTTAGADATSPT